MLVVLSFFDREGVQPPSLKVTVLTFLVKNSKMKLSGESIIILRIREKTWKSNLVLVVVLVVDSEGL